MFIVNLRLALLSIAQANAVRFHWRGSMHSGGISTHSTQMWQLFIVSFFVLPASAPWHSGPLCGTVRCRASLSRKRRCAQWGLGQWGGLVPGTVTTGKLHSLKVRRGKKMNEWMNDPEPTNNMKSDDLRQDMMCFVRWSDGVWMLKYEVSVFNIVCYHLFLWKQIWGFCLAVVSCICGMRLSHWFLVSCWE